MICPILLLIIADVKLDINRGGGLVAPYIDFKITARLKFIKTMKRESL